jgi:hypothetical protein
MATRLYRPVGLNELALIWDTGCEEFPPRLPDQPIFYPVTSAEYATQIARDWNTKASSFAGFVTSFPVDDNYLSGFERHIVGSAAHEEYWIPADQLPNFNRQIQGKIEVEAAFFGKSFIGFVPDKCNFEGKNAEEQFVVLAQSWGYSRMDFGLEISVNRKAVFLNCLYWIDHDFSAFNVTPALKHEVLDGVVKVWEFSRIEPELPRAFIKGAHRSYVPAKPIREGS